MRTITAIQLLIGAAALFLLESIASAQCDPRQVHRIVANNIEGGDFVGTSIDIDGNTAVVGAEGATVDGFVLRPAAHLSMSAAAHNGLSRTS